MAASLDSKIMFQGLCSLFEKVSKAKGAQKVQELQKFTRECRVLASKIKDQNSDADVSLFPVFRLLLPALERDRGPYGLQNKTLVAIYQRVFYLGKNSARADKLTNFRKPGACGSGKNDDLAESVYWLMKNHLPEGGTLSIQHVNEFLDNIAACNEENRSKDEHFRHLTSKVNAMELKWLTRLLLKELKLGLAQKKVFEVIHPEAEAQFNVSSSLRRVCEKYSETVNQLSHTVNSNGISIELFSHVKPMLLERFKIEEAAKLFPNGRQLYYLQTKFDGERSQIHFKAGCFKYFTRKGYDITQNASYGETPESGGFLSSNIAPQLHESCRSVILDGEMMGWHKERKTLGTKALNYDVKKLSENSKHQPCFVAYDILMYNDEPLLDKPYIERLAYLRGAFSEKEGVIMLCDTQTVSELDKLVEIFNLALDNEEEGIVVKRSDALYRPNVRERSGCYKIKAEYSDALVNDLDLLILGGYYGQGRCSGTVSSFLVGVAKPATNKNGMPSEFHAVVSVRSGLSDDQLRIIQNKLKPHWKDKKPVGVFGPRSEPPDVWVSPKHSMVLQLRASEMVRSKSYPIGYSLRFPRVMKIRTDKPWYNACSTTEFESLVKNKKFVQKLTKRKAETSDITQVVADDEEEEEELDAPKIRKTKSIPVVTTRVSASVYGSFVKHNDNDEVQRTSRLFEGKEICVINGDSEMDRQVIVKLLQQHSAKVVQNASKDTFCLLVGDPETLKAQNAIASANHDVVSLDWLRRATKQENIGKIQDFRPWELYAMTVSTRRKLDDAYDQYWDNYTEDLDEETLKRVTKRIEESSGKTEDMSVSEMRKLDKLLFEEGTSPFSVFRGVVAFFGNMDDVQKYSFAFMSGEVVGELNETVTFAFEPIDETMRQFCIERSIPVLRTQWIKDCFKNQRFISIDDYVV
ncbi:DNA ligase 4 isoform X1 [Nasonia vitripennis]|uniref:DNA ligase 4 n=1 Tax=Nasonia vitripennis TaxID=7425 RepID=A0A7M7IVZ0_NASVI|nr:DNA ligase 4 isoform X1 [Nasonia vitripennis]